MQTELWNLQLICITIFNLCACMCISTQLTIAIAIAICIKEQFYCIDHSKLIINHSVIHS